jgi:hypothetical protein
LVPLLTMLAMVAMEGLTRAATGNLHFYQAHGWPKLLGLWLAGTTVWFLGRSLAKKREEQDHSFMGVPLQYWAPVLAVAGVPAAFISEKPQVVTFAQMTEQQATLGDDCRGACTQADGTAEECNTKCQCVVEKLAAQYPTRESWSEFVELKFTDQAQHASQESSVRARCGFQ